jgi:putative nucleotidyltransferase with HDIG domain
MAMPDADLKTVNKIIDQLGELPAAPLILRKALKLTSDIESKIDDVSKNISADQTLTAKVIRLSNSPYYGRVRQISSLHEAIKVLGFNQIRSIVITASTFQMFQSGSHTKIARILWEHSLATALGARLIVQKYGGLDTEEGYLCGLLHDIGKLVLLKTAPHVYEEIIAEVKKTNLPFLEVERSALGFNHVHVGEALLSKWQFPTNLISQISAHHSTKPNQKEPAASLGRVIAMADSIAKYIGASFFEAYRSENESIFFIGKRLISEDDLISLRIDTEANFYYEMNCLND